MRKLFISGIGTDVGKTVVSAILAKAWGMGYWKPVQAGELEYSDSDKVKEWTEGRIPVYPEAFRLATPMSPHAAARIDGMHIAPSSFTLPDRTGDLLIEGAGGLLVPLNDEGDMMIDLVLDFDAELLLVSRNFLGSINQTLLSCEVLKERGIPVRGILFSGREDRESERIIEDRSGYPVLGRVPEGSPGPGMVAENAKGFEGLEAFRWKR